MNMARQNTSQSTPNSLHHEAGASDWIRLKWTEEVLVVRACTAQRGQGLLAVAGATRIEVFYLSEVEETGTITFNSLASFYLGSPVTALAWSPASTSPRTAADAAQHGEDWRIELLACTAEGSVKLLQSFTRDAPPAMTQLTNVRSKPTDADWCAVESYQSCVAVAFEDATLLLIDLAPRMEGEEEGDGDISLDSLEEDEIQANLGGAVNGAAAAAEPASTTSLAPHIRTFTLPYSLLSVSFHASLARLLSTYDTSGILRIFEWTSLPLTPSASESTNVQSIARTTLFTLTSPAALGHGIAHAKKSLGGADWKTSDSNVFGAVSEGTWSVWDLRRLNGGIPVLEGAAWGNVQGGAVFRFSPTNPSLFALLSTSPLTSSPLQIYDASYPTAPRGITRASLSALRNVDGQSVALTVTIAPQEGEKAVTRTVAVEGPVTRDACWLGEGECVCVAIGNEVVLVPA